MGGRGGGLDRTPKMMHAGHHRLCFQETNNDEMEKVGPQKLVIQKDFAKYSKG